jgi:hypothetical protein
MMTKEVDENCYERHTGVKEEKLIFFESIPEKIDYSLGGYYHRECWPRTR